MACSVSKIEGPISKDIEAAINKIEQEGTRATYDRIKEETESIIGSEVLDGMQIGVRIWNKSPCTLRVFSSQGGTKKKDYGSFGPDMNYGCMTRVGASFIVEVDGVTLPELHTNRWKSQHFFVESSPEPLSSPVTKEVAEAAQVYKMLEKVRTHVDATEYKLANRWLQQCRDTLTKPKAVTNLQKLLGAEGFADATKALVEYFDQLEQRIKPHLAFVVPSTTYTARGSSASYGAPVSSFYNRGVSTSYSYAGGGSSISSSYYSTGSAWNAKSSTGFVGLSNQGATCYMNSLLQSLFLTPELRYALYQWQYTPERDPPREECIPYQLQKLFIDLQTSDKRAVETRDLTKSFGWTSGQQFQQQDVSEMFTKLCDALEKSFKGTRGDGVIKALYEGSMKNYVRCQACGYESKREDVFTSLNLTLKPFGESRSVHSVEEALRRLFTPERLDGENQYDCSRCKKKTDALKGCGLQKVPYILTMNLTRFEYDWEMNRRVKINDRVTFDNTLNAADYMDLDAADEEQPEPQPQPDNDGAAGGELGRAQSKRDFEVRGGTILARGSSAVSAERTFPYELFAIAIHSGGTHGGHYYAYCKDFKTDKWYEFNDSTISALSDADLAKAYGGATRSTYGARGYSTMAMSSSSAYMLMYRRIDPSLNVNEISDEHVPAYIKDDLLREAEEKKESEAKKAADLKTKREALAAQKNQICFVVCRGEDMHFARPDKDTFWGDAKLEIYEALGIGAQPDCLRLCFCRGMKDHYGEALLEDEMVKVGRVEGLEGAMLIVEEKAADLADWPDPKFAPAPDDEATVFFTNIGEDEQKHALKIDRNATMGEVKAKIAEVLGAKPAEIKLASPNGTERCGINRTLLVGPTPHYGTENVCAAIHRLGEAGAEIAPIAIRREIAGNPAVGLPAPPNSLGHRFYNFTPYTVTLMKYTTYKSAYYSTTTSYAQYLATLQPGCGHGQPVDAEEWDTVAAVTRSKAQKGLANHGVGQRYQAKITSIGFADDFTVGDEPRCHIFFDGQGPEAALLKKRRAFFRVTKKVVYNYGTSANLYDTKYTKKGFSTVPFYMYKGANDDLSEYLFDFEVEEQANVLDFKKALATKMAAEGIEAQPEHLRVRELGTPTWPGKVFIDSQRVIDPVNLFNGTEKFAISILPEPESKRNATQGVITLVKFTASKMELDADFIELVVEPTMTCDELRARIAELDSSFGAAENVAIACAAHLTPGSIKSDLSDTVYDAMVVQWNWDKARSMIGMRKHSAMLDGKIDDGARFLYRDAREPMPELAPAEREAFKKRAVLAQRKKKNAGNTRHARAEVGISINVQGAKVAAADTDANADVNADANANANPNAAEPAAGEDGGGAALGRTFSSQTYDKMLANPKLSAAQRAKIEEMKAKRRAKEGAAAQLEEFMQQSDTRRSVALARAELRTLAAIAPSNASADNGLPDAASYMAEVEAKSDDALATEVEMLSGQVEALRAELGLC